MDALQDHPIASIFPLLAEPELAELAESIKWDGVQVPIVLYEGKILDGRNRYRAAQMVGAHVPQNYYTGESPTAHVIALNLKRKHYTASERAMAAAAALPSFEAEAATRRQHSKIVSDAQKGRAVDKAARALGVNPSYVSAAKKLSKEAPDLAADVRAGKTTLSKAKAAAAARVRPITETELSPKQKAKVAAAEKDSETLWLLKSYWKKAKKKDRAAFRAWIANK